MFTYLWSNRERPRLFSRRFFKVWLKRAYHGKTLIKLDLLQIYYKVLGMKIGNFSIVHSFKRQGNPKNISIGSNSFISNTVHMASHEKILIGNRVVINDYVCLLTASHDLKDPAWPMIMAPIIIKDYAWIATRAVILPGVTIGTGAVIGAGAVVAKDVPDYHIAFGNPAQLSLKKRTEGLNYNPVNSIAVFEAWLGSEFRQPSF